MNPAFLAAIMRAAILASGLTVVSALHGSSPGTSQDSDALRGEAEGTASAPPGSGAVFPEHLRRFDIVCDVHGWVSGILYPENLPSSPTVDGEPWQYVRRRSIDLDRMQVCWAWCEAGLPVSIAADQERITFRNDPRNTSWVRRRDGAYYLHMEQEGRITDERGICRPASFTEFPEMEVVEREPEPIADKPALADEDADSPPRAPDDTSEPLSFPTDWRRFDILCTFSESGGAPSRAAATPVPAPADDFPRGYFKLSIDLEAAWSCPQWCDGGSMDRPIAVDADRITFRGRPGVTSWLDRNTGEYHIRRDDAGRTVEATGQCVPRPHTPIR